MDNARSIRERTFKTINYGEYGGKRVDIRMRKASEILMIVISVFLIIAVRLASSIGIQSNSEITVAISKMTYNLITPAVFIVDVTIYTVHIVKQLKMKSISEMQGIVQYEETCGPYVVFKIADTEEEIYIDTRIDKIKETRLSKRGKYKIARLGDEYIIMKYRK